MDCSRPGTTGAGLRAGIPNIVVPFAGDQPFWGTQPAPVKRLTSRSLTAELQTALRDANMQACAARIGEKIRAEQGVQAALRLVEVWAEKFGVKK